MQRKSSTQSMNRVAHVVCDLNGRFLEVDDAYSQLLGYDKRDFSRKTIIAVTCDQDRGRNKNCLENLVSNNVPFEIRKRYIASDGQIVWVENYVSRTFSFRGRSNIVATVRQIDNPRPSIETMIVEANDRAASIAEQTRHLLSLFKEARSEK